MKKSLAIETIKTIALNPKGLDVLISSFARVNNLLGKNNIDENEKEKLKDFFTSAVFLSQFEEALNTVFTEKEMANLLEIFQSKIMVKYLENAGVFEPLYSAMRSHIQTHYS